MIGDYTTKNSDPEVFSNFKKLFHQWRF